MSCKPFGVALLKSFPFGCRWAQAGGVEGSGFLGLGLQGLEGFRVEGEDGDGMALAEGGRDVEQGGGFATKKKKTVVVFRDRRRSCGDIEEGAGRKPLALGLGVCLGF